MTGMYKQFETTIKKSNIIKHKMVNYKTFTNPTPWPLILDKYACTG